MRNVLRHLDLVMALLIVAELAILIDANAFQKIGEVGVSKWMPAAFLGFAIVGIVRLRLVLGRQAVSFFSKAEPSIQGLSKQVLCLADETSLARSRGKAVVESVHQTSEAITEIVSHMRLTERNTSSASGQSQSNLESTFYGSRTVDALALRMKNVLDGSKEIQKFSDTLEEIALQTNILALNAAVEAAHAGEFAGGFNVIANSIRDLSVKSAEAAKRIQKLVVATNEEISEACVQTETTKSAFENLRASTEQISQFLLQIAAACKEQTVGIDQIALAVQRIESETGVVESCIDKIAKFSKDIGTESDEILINNKVLKAMLIAYSKPSPDDGIEYLRERLQATGKLAVGISESDSNLTINAGPVDLSKDFSTLDDVKIVTGGVATVFAFDPTSSEFIRISTNILRPDGARALKTPLAAGKAKDELLLGRALSGTFEILNRSYECAYQPLIVADTVVGAIFFGYLVS